MLSDIARGTVCEAGVGRVSVGALMPGKIISLVNFKGGVGKTTLTVNLAACLSKEHDKKVLIVDLDPQSNASIWLLGPERWSLSNSSDGLMRTSAALLHKTWSENIFINPYVDKAGTFLPRLHLCPATLGMLKLESIICLWCNKRKLDGTYKLGDEYCLFANAAQSLREKFDFVLIDCPPNLYLGTCNALCHSDYIIIPCIPDTLSTSGLKQMVEEMEKIITPLVTRQRLSQAPVILGIAVTKFREQLNEHQSGLDIIESIISGFQTGDYRLADNQTLAFRDRPIGEYVVHAEAVQDGLPLCFYAPMSKAYGQVAGFTQAVLDAIRSRE